MQRLLLGVTIIFLYSCTSLVVPEVPEYRLNQTGDLIVSDSSNLWRFFESRRPRRVLQATLIVKNMNPKKQYQINLADSFVDINGVREKISCKDTQNSNQIQLKESAQAKIICDLELHATEQNKLGIKDTRAVLNIPTDQNVIQIDRLFRIEEFQ